MNSRFRQAAFVAILSTLAVLVVLALDFSVRQVYLRLRSQPVALGPKFPREKHPFYHHGLKPNASGFDTYGSLQTPYFSNSLGMRDVSKREIPPNGSDPRILLIGDSFTEGIGIPWAETFAGILAETMQSQSAEVLNSGVASYCPAIELARLRWLMERQGLQVQRVVLFLDIADLRDELSYETAPDGSIHDKGGTPLSLAHPTSDAGLEKMKKWNQIILWLHDHVEENFVLLGAVVRNLRLTWEKHGSQGGVRASDLKGDWGGEWPDYRGPMEPAVEAGLRGAKQSMDQLKEFLDARKVPLTLIIYPWPQQIRAGTRPSRMESEWQTWAAQRAVPVINLFPLFLDTENSREEIIRKYYIPGDFHWNAQGHAHVAQFLLSAPIQPLWGKPVP
jgi:hypothetical protein